MKKEKQIKKGDVIFEMENVTKKFPGVTALDNIQFNLKAGEVHVLLGENGAGKSTLIKIMTGAYTPTEGVIRVQGEEVKIDDPIHAQELGVGAVYQEFNLVPFLDVAQNVFLGKEPRKNGVIDRQYTLDKTKEALDMVGADIKADALVDTLGVASQQMVEIAKALNSRSKILILDEPSAVLTEKEIEKLFKVIERLTAEGVGVVYISHRLEEINVIADRVTVLRDGQYIQTVEVEKGKIDKDELVRLMVGRTLDDFFPKHDIEPGEEILRVENLGKKGVLENISFSLKKGEILGIGGLVGAGRTELAKAIFGAEPADSGKIFVHGKEVSIQSPSAGIANHIGVAPEDRKKEGLVQILEIDKNINLASMQKISRGPVVNFNKMDKVSNSMVDKLKIKTPHLKQLIMNLSGGNQQKVVLAKWLASDTEILILDEPTRGIDVGAKVEVYNLMNELAAAGKAIIMVSSELPELIAMSDRILVMHSGTISGELSKDEFSQERVLKLAAGGEA
ncbi:MAG: sugar ABC transporter ATP-binding protein [Spirochaetales bacterium]|nr:sugar ABC transporter ATP-binding protein [Spirochaetales bacterium]